MKPTMTSVQLADYEAQCLEAGIDPQIGRLRARVQIEGAPRPRRPSDVPRVVWLRTLGELLIGWSLASLAAWWLASDAVAMLIAGILALTTFVIVWFVHRRDWDRAWHAARWAPWPGAVFAAVLAIGGLFWIDAPPERQTTSEPTIGVANAPGGGGGPAAPTPEPPSEVYQVIPLLPTAAPTIGAFVIDLAPPTIEPPTPAPTLPPVAVPTMVPPIQPTAIPPTPEPRTSCADHLLVVDGVQTAAPCGGGESSGSWGGGGESSGTWGTP